MSWECPAHYRITAAIGAGGIVALRQIDPDTPPLTTVRIWERLLSGN